MRHVPARDVLATCLVGAAAVVYALWLAGAAPDFLDSTRTTGIVVLGLGFVASAVAVVPGVDRLLHGGRLYLVVTSVAGLVAAVAGVAVVWTADGAALTTLMVVMVALWVVATVHHAELALADERASGEPRGHAHAGAR